MEHIIWSKGEKVERSYKNDNPSIKQIDNNNNNNNIKIIEKDGFISGSNKRELASIKMNDRNMISQIGQNPFMTNNNYLHDLEIQQNFLIPQNSNYTPA